MSSRWLTLFIIAFVAVIVFIFFYFFLQPVWTPEKAKEQREATLQETLTEPTVSFVNPKKGAAEPLVVVVEFGDFQCEPCRETAAALDDLLGAVPEARVVWKNMPNESTHELSVPSAVAAHCAGAQGKFWEYHNLLFDQQGLLTEYSFTGLAAELGLDSEKFQKCFTAQEPLPLIRKDFEEALALKITTTPTIFIGQERITGQLSSSELISWAKEQLEKVK